MGVWCMYVCLCVYVRACKHEDYVAGYFSYVINATWRQCMQYLMELRLICGLGIHPLYNLSVYI